MRVFCERLLIGVCAAFTFDFEVGVWDLIVFVPDHCLSFCFPSKMFNLMQLMLCVLKTNTILLDALSAGTLRHEN